MLLIINEKHFFVNDNNAVNIRISVNLFETFYLKIYHCAIDRNCRR